jgi:cell division protein FtsB
MTKSEARRKRLLLIGFCGLFLFSLLVSELVGKGGYFARRQQRQQIQALQEEISELKQENLFLSEQIRALRSDPEAIEEVAREQLRLARPGEVVVTIPPSVSSTTDEPAPLRLQLH